MIPDTTTTRVADPGVLRSHSLVWGIVTVAAILGVLLLGFTLGKWITGSDSDVVELPRQAATAAVVAAPQSVAASAPVAGLAVGQPAPDFALLTPDGQTMQLSDFKGHPVLLNFWATWCGPCLAEMPLLKKTYDDLKDSGLVLLAVDVQEKPDTVRKFAEKEQLPFTVLLDETGLVATYYRVTAYPTTFFVDANGVVQSWQRGTLTKTTLDRHLDRIR